MTQRHSRDHPVIVFGRTMDRRSFLRGAAAAGALGLVGRYVLGPGDFADAQSDEAADLLNLSLTVESLLCAGYERALDGGQLTSSDRELIEPILQHEYAYVEALTRAVQDYGARPIGKPSFTFPSDRLADRLATLQTLSDLEDISIRTWQGQLPLLGDPSLMPFLKPVVLAKPRHAAVVSWLSGRQPFPDPIEPTFSIAEALDAITEYRAVA